MRLEACGVTTGVVYGNYNWTFHAMLFLYNITYSDILDPSTTVNKIVVVQAFYASRLRAPCLLGSLSRVKGRFDCFINSHLKFF